MFRCKIEKLFEFSLQEKLSNSSGKCMEYLYFECQYQKSFYQDRKNYLTRFHEYYLKYYAFIRSCKILDTEKVGRVC